MKGKGIYYISGIFIALVLLNLDPARSHGKDFNEAVIETIREYPTDGTHAYDWPKKGQGKEPYDGSSEDIFYQNTRIMKGNGKGSTFCCGLTLEVFLKTADKYLSDEIQGSSPTLVPDVQEGFMLTREIPHLKISDFDAFKGLWFCTAVNSPGPGDALTTYGLGTILTDWSQAQPGDFMQIWRHNGSGHSVIFTSWIYGPDKGIKGVKYWSTQTKTGIAYATEYFGETGKTLDRTHTYLSRVIIPNQLRSE